MTESDVIRVLLEHGIAPAHKVFTQVRKIETAYDRWQASQLAERIHAYHARQQLEDVPDLLPETEEVTAWIEFIRRCIACAALLKLKQQLPDLGQQVARQRILMHVVRSRLPAELSARIRGDFLFRKNAPRAVSATTWKVALKQASDQAAFLLGCEAELMRESTHASIEELRPAGWPAPIRDLHQALIRLDRAVVKSVALMREPPRVKGTDKPCRRTQEARIEARNLRAALNGWSERVKATETMTRPYGSQEWATYQLAISALEQILTAFELFGDLQYVLQNS